MMNQGQLNPYNLANRQIEGNNKAVVAKVLTLEEQADKLIGYHEVPPEIWEYIKTNSHLRYYTKTTGFKPGGFVHTNPFYTKEGGNGKPYIKLKNGFQEKAGNYAQWIVNYDDIDKIYIKLSATDLTILKTMNGAISELNSNMKIIETFIKKMDSRLTNIEKVLNI